MGNQLPAVIRVSDHPSLRAWLNTGTVMGMFGRSYLSLAKESFTLEWFLALSPLSLGWSLMLFWLRRKKQKMPLARSSSHVVEKCPSKPSWKTNCGRIFVVVSWKFVIVLAYPGSSM